MTSPGSKPTGALQSFDDVACTVCGCVCDDLRVTVSGQRILKAEGACALAEPWFAELSNAPARPAVMVDGKAAAFADAVDRSAEILRESRGPLVFGLARSSTEGQRAAVKLAEQIGATIDTAASVRSGASIVAMQAVGDSTCSLGEVRNRADLVIFWGADPLRTHPRHWERYSVEAKGLFVPRGREDRTVVVIDAAPTATSERADVFIQASADRNFDVIWALRQLVRGEAMPAEFDAGAPQEQLGQLATQMKSCRYGAVFYGSGLAHSPDERAGVEALLRLVRELNDHTRFTVHRLTAPGGMVGAEAVLCWLTGFPFAVNFARGYPRYSPGEFSANNLLERGEVDAAVFVGSEPLAELSPAARQAVRGVPTIALDYPHIAPALAATVQFTTAVYGIHAAGTAYRMDDIPIPLRQIMPSAHPTDDEVLEAIAARLR